VKIHLPAYPSGVHTISESLSASELDLDPLVFCSPIQAVLTLDRHDPYLHFVFGIRTSVRLECDRCLTVFDCALEMSNPMLYVIGSTPRGEDVDDPEIAYVPAGTTDLDITADLRDFIILALPEKHLCRDECRGICPGCGSDLNTQTCTCAVRDSVTTTD